MNSRNFFHNDGRVVRSLRRLRRSFSTLFVVGALVAMPIVASAGELDPSYAGVWVERGYGRVLQISPTRIVTYDLTDVSCAKVEDQPLKEAAREYEKVERVSNGFTLFEVGGITRYEFRGLQKLPQRCLGLTRAKANNDPETNFWVLWHALRENYAFFDVRGVDWDEVYAQFRPSIKPETTPDELFDIFSEMLAELDDGHVELNSDDDEFASGDDGELLELWKSLHGGSERGYEEAVRKHIVTDVLKGRFKSGAAGALVWGWAAPGVGYINVLSMEPDDSLSLPAQLELVEQTMAQVMADLGRAHTLIVDARFNDGGHDSIALEIMGSFTSDKRFAFSKKAVDGAGFTPRQDVSFGPRGASQFPGDIYYLQSGTTISAGEIFSLAMYALPKVTSIGTPTYGALSDQLEKTLPNGWSVTVSNEVYLAFDGRLFEKIGVPPDVPLDVSAIRNFDARLQLDIDTALQRIGRK